MAFGGGGSKGGSSGYGGGGSGMSSRGMSAGGGYGGGSGGGGMSGYGMGGGGGQVVQAAVQSKHQIEYRDVPSSQETVPTTIEVGANSVPLNILFRSASSNLNIQQMHEGAGGSNQETSSEDEPHLLKHQVTKPIIQEEIQPVQEEILTIVARGQDQKKDSYGGSGGGGAGGAGGYGGGASKMSQMSSYGGSGGGAGGSSAGGRKGY
ncbi:PREDICTED: pupal cuticle protein 36a-like [Rhagoletis zephyria]|uniref:pupal cuticle protein 36a-like n=1 Tax=Rhagoletis zephyria TaxID=28612 RepID=UPI0008115E18|nr:PREDICTED: pupal cuticle protein 36a-like [Rhagoletis zephyria]